MFQDLFCFFKYQYRSSSIISLAGVHVAPNPSYLPVTRLLLQQTHLIIHTTYSINTLVSVSLKSVGQVSNVSVCIWQPGPLAKSP